MSATKTNKAAAFVDFVLNLQPRLAVFDCDGTLWAGDAGEGFFDWELRERVVSDEIIRWARPRYADYKAGKVIEDDMCGEMATMHRGMRETEVQQAAEKYFASFAKNIFPEMQQLIERLNRSGCEVWAVSSTNLWVIQAAMKHFAIVPERILAATAVIENGVVTNRLVRVPTGAAKPDAIRQVIQRTPDAAFGNSRWDTEMLAMSRHPFAVSPFPELEKTAREKNWTIYWPDGTTDR